MRKLLILVLVCLISVNCIQVNANRDNFTDTYVATDELGRKLPTNKEAGNVKKDKYVGIFYFLFMDAANTRLLDHSRIYANYGTEAVWDVLVQNGMHLWGEPYFGYYKNTDEWIYRKHANMLSLAGVDFVFLDTTNQGGLFPHAWKTMFEVWNDIREKGGTTPQIAFHCGDNADTMELHVSQLPIT